MEEEIPRVLLGFALFRKNLGKNIQLPFQVGSGFFSGEGEGTLVTGIF